MVVTVRLPIALVDAIRDKRGERGRSKFLTQAGWEKLAAEDGAPEVNSIETGRPFGSDLAREMLDGPNEDDVENPEPADPEFTADEFELLCLVKNGAIAARVAERQLGWQGLRFGNAERSLSKRGLIAYENGMLVHR